MTLPRRTAAVLSLSLLITGAISAPAHAGIVDDATGFLGDLAGDAGAFLDDIGVGPVMKNGYNAVSDLLFSYETQPDDADMENLAKSWAITAWLADENKKESNVYYFDNHTLTMVEDPSQIGHGYNLGRSPEGSTLSGRHTGILKAVVADASNYTVSWANYEDEVNFYLMEKMREKNAPETEEAADASAADDNAGNVASTVAADNAGDTASDGAVDNAEGAAAASAAGTDAAADDTAADTPADGSGTTTGVSENGADTSATSQDASGDAQENASQPDASAENGQSESAQVPVVHVVTAGGS